MRTGSEKKHGGCWECGRGTADTQQLLLKGSQHRVEATFSAKDLFCLNSIPVSPGKTLAAISKVTGCDRLGSQSESLQKERTKRFLAVQMNGSSC